MSASTRARKQRLAALRAANEVRSARAQAKRELRDGTAEIAALLADPPDHLVGMNVSDLLRALPKFGPHRARYTLEACRISAAETLGGLSASQRRELAAELAPSLYRSRRGAARVAVSATPPSAGSTASTSRDPARR